MAAHVLLVTADLRTFVSSGERNQAFIDGGLYAMSLMYALQARGIASCPLNLGLSFLMDRALRKAAKLPPNENLIMMIAIGYPPDELAIAASARVPTDAMLRFHDLKTE
jgi:nitroreductase